MTESTTLTLSPVLSHEEIGELSSLTASHVADGASKESSRSLKLAFLTTEYPKASHTFVRRELLALEQRGHEITRLSIRDATQTVVDPADKAEAEKTIICLNLPKLQMIVSTIAAILTRPRPFFDACRAVFQMWKVSDRGLIRHVAYLIEAATLLPILKKRGVTHIHTHFGKNAADVALLIKRLGGPTYSLMIHGPGEFDGPRTFSLGAKVAESEFTAAISYFATGQLRRWVPFEHWSRMHVIRCTIGDDFLKQIHPVDESSSKLVCIGRLTAQKGQLLLIDAVHQLVSEGIDVQLVLAGDGEMRRAIEDRIEELGVGQHVTITGWINEQQVRQLLIESRGMVLPSFAEGLPVAIMEALALGRPVVSTSIAAIPELLRDGENGWVIPSGCMDDLVAALRELLQTPAERLSEMGRAGHERVRRQHHTETEAAKLEALFQQYGC